MKREKLCVLVVALVMGLSLMSVPISAKAAYESISDKNEWNLLKEVNKQRVSKGVEPLTMFTALQNAAGIRAKEISSSFSHNRPDGKSFSSVLKECGIPLASCGENIAAGYTSASAVMAAWMGSQGHKENILKEAYTHGGMGYYAGGEYGKNWAQIFLGGCDVTDVAADSLTAVTYDKGTSIDEMNRYLVVTCDVHGKGYLPITKELCTGYDESKAGAQEIVVKCYGEKIKIPVVVKGDEDPVLKAPYRVKSLKVTKKGFHSVTLKWAKRNCDGYEVYRATKKNGPYKKIKTIKEKSKNTIKIKNLKSGKKYYFKVCAYRKNETKIERGKKSKAVVVRTR